MIRSLLSFVPVLLLILTWALPVQAQIRLGAKLGVSSSGLRTEEQGFADPGQGTSYLLKLDNGRAGFQAGAFLQIRLGLLLFQPELLYDTYAVDYELSRLADDGSSSPVLIGPRERFHYLDFPLLVGLALGPVRLQAGPEGRLYLGSDSDLDSFVGYQSSFPALQWGWEAGLGIDIWKLSADLRYEGQLNRYGNHIRLYGEKSPFDQRLNRFLIQLGYRF